MYKKRINLLKILKKSRNQNNLLLTLKIKKQILLINKKMKI